MDAARAGLATARGGKAALLKQVRLRLHGALPTDRAHSQRAAALQERAAADQLASAEEARKEREIERIFADAAAR